MTTLMHRKSDRMKAILQAANQVDADPTLSPEEPTMAGDANDAATSITKELVE